MSKPRTPDWVEDFFQHENGNYQCKCADCDRLFVGHKRRHQCKLCFDLAAALARVEAAEADARRYRWLQYLTYGERTPDGEQMFVLPDPVPVGNIMRGSIAEHLDAAIDAAIAQEPKHGS